MKARFAVLIALLTLACSGVTTGDDDDAPDVCCYYANGADNFLYRWHTAEECEEVQGKVKEDEGDQCDDQADVDKLRESLCCCEKNETLVNKKKNKCAGTCNPDYFEETELKPGGKCQY